MMILPRTTTLVSLLLLAVWGAGSGRSAEAAGRVISNSEARRLGLERAWYAQVGLDIARERVAELLLHRDTLLVRTDRSVVYALDAESGRRMWTSQLGQSGYPSLEMSASDAYVALVNGSTLHVVDRLTGRQVWEQQLAGAPAAGPAISGRDIYVPLMSSKIAAYDVQITDRSPWTYGTDGRSYVQPLATTGGVGWATDSGYFYVGWADVPAVRFRVRIGSEIAVRPVYQEPHYYVASAAGDVFAIDEASGERQWRFSAGGSVRRPLSVIRPPGGDISKGRVFVCPGNGGMYCIAEQTGRQLWWAPEVSQPVAVTPGHVYGVDPLGQLHILDAETGARRGMLKTEPTSVFLLNSQTDRVYLASETGLIHCLRESGIDEPIRYGDSAAEQPAADETPADPFGDEVLPAEPSGDEEVDPFGDPDEDDPVA